MLSAALLIGLSLAIVIDAVSQFIDLEAMTKPFAIFVTGASCIVLNIGSRLYIQACSSVKSGLGGKRPMSKASLSGSNQLRQNDIGELGNPSLPFPINSSPSGNNRDSLGNKISSRMGGYIGKSSSCLWLFALTQYQEGCVMYQEASLVGKPQLSRCGKSFVRRTQRPPCPSGAGRHLSGTAQILSATFASPL
jgi:hypothetical protein